VPQMASWRLSERFRWPTNEVLLLSCGVVASPAPGATGVLSILGPLGVSTSRADALLMIEHRDPSVTGLAAAAPPPPSSTATIPPIAKPAPARSEERRVGKECRSRWSPDDEKKK